MTIIMWIRLSRYRLAYIIGFVVILIVIMIICKKCQNTPFLTRFPHCVEMFEEMVGNWCVWAIWLKSAFIASPDRLYFIWKSYTYKKKYYLFIPSILPLFFFDVKSPLKLFVPAVTNWTCPPLHWLYQSNVRLRWICQEFIRHFNFVRWRWNQSRSIVRHK